MADVPEALELAHATADRLDAQRRLRSIPAELLDSAWVRDAQTEAVIDALLICSMAADRCAYVHARGVGEWAARIAAVLPGAPSPAFMRRCGVLADLDPTVLEKIPEVRYCAPAVRAFQRLRMGAKAGVEAHIAALIVAVADEFDSLLAGDDGRRGAAHAMRTMTQCANDEGPEAFQALTRAARATKVDSLSATAFRNLNC